MQILENGSVHLKIGHCCVREIDHIVPTEFITAVLTQVVLQHGSVEAAMASVDWPADFKKDLIAKIERR